MDKRAVLLSGLALAALAPAPAAAQSDAWQRKWYWGGQGGIFMYQSRTDSTSQFAITAGGHWLITGKRSALLIGFDHIMFPDSSTSMINDNTTLTGTRLVDFSTGRRIQAVLYAVPSDSWIQIMLGGGFAIHQLTNATPLGGTEGKGGPFATLAEQTNAQAITADQDTRAFAVMSGGAQLRLGRLALFAQYQYTPAAKNFLLRTAQHSATAGIRFALTTAHEDVTTDR